MKRNYFFRLALLLIVTVYTGQKALATAQLPTKGSGTVDNPYQIGTLADWNNLADYVVEGNNCAGLYFKMTANIGTTAEPVTTPLGKQTGSGHNTRKRFAGIFDGDGHTLTVNIDNNGNPWYANNASYCAPFAYAQNITIRNLTVLGTITTTGQFASGLVGQTGPDGDKTKGTCVIENCHVGATFVGNTAGNSTNGNHGIFISVAEGNVTITNSWFDGVIDGKNYYYSGGFIGLNKATATLTDCLFNPASIASTVNYKQSSEFSHDIGGTSKLTRCYYTKSFSDPETAQGQRVKIGVVVDNDDYRYSYTTIEDDNGNVLYKTPDGENYYIVKENCIWTRIQTDYINTAENSYSLGDVSDERLIEGKLVAGKDNVAFVIPAGKTFTLDLGGKTIDRDLDVVNPAPADVDGFVIKVEAGAKLTITNGTIQHGHHRSNGGCIYNAGELILDDVTITGNYADGNGAGIYNAGTLSLNNVTITGNHVKSNGAGTGAGVYNTSTGILKVKGNVQITDNTSNNVYLVGDRVIVVYGTLGENASVGVTKQNGTGTITAQLINQGTVANFFSDNANYFVDEDESGNGVLSEPISLSLADATDNTSTIAGANGKLANVTLTGRTLYKDGFWNTLCLPFDVDNTQMKAVLGGSTDLRELTSASLSNGTLTINFNKVSAIEAGKPYIVKWGVYNNLEAPVFEKVTIKDGLNDATFGNISFKGTYAPLSFTAEDKSILFMGIKEGKSVLYYPGNGAYINSQRAYFKIGGNEIKAFNLNFGDEDDPTGIFVVENINNQNNNSWYDLNGRKLSGKPAQKGIYVNNGKKIVIK